MKSGYTLFFICLIFLYTNHSQAQRSAISIGVKGGIGISVPNPNSTTDFDGQSYSLYTNAYYKGGIAGQYILGDVLGIETALLTTYISYTRKDSDHPFLANGISWGNNIEVSSYQVPIQLMYILRLRNHPNMRIKLTGGVAMDWLKSVYSYGLKNNLFINSFLCGARIKTSTGKYGYMEYGLEYQYALNGMYDFDVHSHGIQTLHSKYSILSFNIYYFFFNKARTNQKSMN